mmetsp:Transcript_38020/g.43411  ORF Transcript_38020/g.43411 Transcript_38020/m.43411 type:complete len:124 (+) Transcript_38020:84-455(+)
MISTSFLILLLATCARAFTPISQRQSKVTSLNAHLSSRKAFLTITTAASVATIATVTTSTPAFAKGDYSLDVIETKVETPKKEGNEGASLGLVGGVLAGGFAISLPFFLPNILRILGVNNAKL